MKFLKENLGIIIIITLNLIALVSFFNHMDARIEVNVVAINEVEKDLINHQENPDVHMKWKNKIETFVLRNEYQPTVKEMKEDLKIIKSDIKEILKKVR